MKLLILFLFCTPILAQNTSVIYKNDATLPASIKQVLKKSENDDEAYKKSKGFADALLNLEKVIKYELLFSKNKAIFEPIKDTTDNYLVSLSKQKKGVYYEDTSDKKDYFQTAINIKFLKIKNKIMDWKITDESKSVLGYRCLKAVGFTELLNDNFEIKKEKVVAWYALKLPFSYGPQGYGGLPGLILEMTLANNHYVAIESEDSEKSVEEPKKGDFITLEAYTELKKKRFEAASKF